MSSSAPSDLTPISAVPEELATMVGLLEPPAPGRPAKAATALAVIDPGPFEVDTDFVGDLMVRYLELGEENGRNQAWFEACCQLRDDGCDQAFVEAVAALFVDAAPPTNPVGVEEPFTLTEALSTVRSVYSRPPRDPWPGRGQPSGPVIQVNNRQLRDLCSEIEAAVTEQAGPLGLYRRGNMLVQLRFDDDGQPMIEVLDRRQFRRLVTDVADFVSVTDEGTTNARPPMDAVDGVLGQGEWPGIPSLVGLTEVPVVRPDASILIEPGYDEATRLLYVPAEGLVVPPVPEVPTAADIEQARKGILGLFEEFCFEPAASLANAVGLLLTAVVRTMIDGLVPLALVTAPQAGTGKTLVVKVVGIVATGRSTPAMAWPRTEEEVEKRVSAKLLTGNLMLLIDNLHDGGALMSPSLDALLTTEVWEGRRLGQSEMLQLRHNMVIAATGNNLSVAGDLHRRSYPIVLDAKTAHPEDREFRRPDLEAWVREHRGELLAWVFTLVRAWDRAGRPGPSSGIRLASYQRWVDIIGGILEVAGIDGFLDNRGDIASQLDEEAGEWAVFLEVLRAKTSARAHTVAELRALIEGDAEVNQVVPRSLAESLEAAVHKGSGSVGSRLGNQLARRRKRRFAEDGLRIEDAGQDPATKAKRWRVVTDHD